MSPSATQNLVDGQAMPFTVTRTALGTSAGLEIAAVGTGWCASDVQLPVSESPVTRASTRDHRVSPVELPEHALNCLDYVNSDLSSSSSAARICRPSPPSRTPYERRWSAGDYPTVSGQALAEIGQGGQQPLPFNNLSVNCLPSEPCTFAVAVWTKKCSLQVSTTSTSWGFLSPSSTRRPACSAMVRHRARSPSASPDRLSETLTLLGIDACKSGAGSGKRSRTTRVRLERLTSALCSFASEASTWPTAQSATARRGRHSHRRSVKVARAFATLRRHTNRIEHGGARTLAERGATATLRRLRDRADRLFAAQDHPRCKLAQLLSNGGYEDISGSGQVTNDIGTWASQLGQGLLALNPQLSSGYLPTCTGCGDCRRRLRGGRGCNVGTDATTYLATSFLALWCLRSWPAARSCSSFGSERLGTSRTSARRLRVQRPDLHGTEHPRPLHDTSFRERIRGPSPTPRRRRRPGVVSTISPCRRRTRWRTLLPRRPMSPRPHRPCRRQWRT